MADIPATPAPVPAPAPAAPLPRKHSLGKIVLRGLGVLFILLVVFIVVLYFARNILVARAITFGGKYATDQDTTLNAADLALSGNLGLSQLAISNLPGYDPKNQLLQMKDGKISVETGSLLTDTVVVNSIDISGLDITVEQKDLKNNLSDLLAIIQKKSPAAGSSDQTPGKKLVVKTIHLTDVKLHLRGNIFQQNVSMDFDLGDIKMDDITNPDGRATKIADVISKILLRVSLQVLHELSSNKLIPPEFAQGMQNVSGMLNNLKGGLLKGDFAKNIDNLKDLSSQLQNTLDAVKKKYPNLNLPSLPKVDLPKVNIPGLNLGGNPATQK